MNKNIKIGHSVIKAFLMSGVKPYIDPKLQLLISNMSDKNFSKNFNEDIYLLIYRETRTFEQFKYAIKEDKDIISLLSHLTEQELKFYINKYPTSYSKFKIQLDEKELLKLFKKNQKIINFINHPLSLDFLDTIISLPLKNETILAFLSRKDLNSKHLKSLLSKTNDDFIFSQIMVRVKSLDDAKDDANLIKIVIDSI